MLRRISLTLLAATAIGVVACQGASAADLARKAPAPAPLPAPVQDWSGIYVGIEGGGGWGHQDGFTDPFSLHPNSGTFFDNTSGFSDEGVFDFIELESLLNHHSGSVGGPLAGINTSGWLFGAFFGAQKQWGNWVLGIEGDVDGGNIKGSANGSRTFQCDFCDIDEDGHFALKHSASLESKIDELASIRGKIGYAWSPNWMTYATGGAAFAHVKNSLTSSQSVDFSEFDGFFACKFDCFITTEDFAFHAANAFTASADQTMLGWTIGAGIDYKWQLDPGSALVFGVEYQYFNFPTQTFTLSGPSGLSLAVDTKETINVVKGRISYLFSIH
jgi:opacity protein-like surface antigen